ncbi:methyltransferase [Methyloceanibacter sp.]|uniref:methyltransferase n=1 Tax=Methyloceanibacter sp. TaxID=1965321 RepID=UPI002D22930B|nr:methyltransferase [Methyloceanibacter sp.]HZP08551.1 methyltransferase [Methyloceanibacter sp.]
MSDRTTHTELPPQAVFAQLLFGKQLTYSLSGVARLGVADHMGKTARPVEELAAKTGAHAPSLYRVMRMLASLGVFREGPKRHFALTPVGELLKTDAPISLRYMAIMFGEEFSTRAYAHFTDCLRTGGDGVTKAYGKDIWQVLAEHPAQCEVFQQAMTANSSASVPAIVEAYDFTGIKRIADVGGGHGLLLGSILRGYPAMKGVLFDRPEVVGSLPKTAFAGLEGRVAVEGGSFFERVPDDCDAYIMKHIIHDWDDDHCRTILRLMREKLPKNGRVLVCDMVVGDDPDPTPAKMLDIEMLVMTVGGKERTEAEFAELFASSGLKLNRIVATAPTARPVAVIEAVPA